MTPHGNPNKYSNDDCRCAPCTAAHADRIAERRRKRRKSVAKNGLPRTVPHGRSAYVNWGCRCDVCRADHAAYDKARR